MLPFPLLIRTDMAAAAAAVMFASFLLFVYCTTKPKSCSNSKRPPTVGGAWPVIGHLHLLTGAQPPHITLGNLADKYGPIFTLNLGVHNYVIIINSEVAKECLSTHDRALASRPESLAMEILGYNYTTFGFSPYGPLWRTLRKIAVHELLSNHHLEMIKNVCKSEVETSMKLLYDGKGSRVEMQRWFGDVTLNVISRISIGRRLVVAGGDDEDGNNRMYQEVFRDYFELAGKFVISDSLPFLRWLDIGGCERAMKKKMEDLDELFQQWLEEHKQEASVRVDGEFKDFMDMLLADIHNHPELSNYDADTVIKASCLTLIVAASDTTSITLTWALSLLLNNPNVMFKARQELDNQVGKERQVQKSDMKNLVYLQAILKETLRLYPAAPLLVPHQSLEDCTVMGYHVPAGTRIMINAYKIHRDPQNWSNPFEFNPDRFFTSHKDVDVKGKNFELIPFGSGRRMCLGINFGMEVMQFVLASLLQGFELSKPSHEPIDMGETSGMTNLKSTPLEVFLKPRLPTY